MVDGEQSLFLPAAPFMRGKAWGGIIFLIEIVFRISPPSPILIMSFRVSFLLDRAATHSQK